MKYEICKTGTSMGSVIDVYVDTETDEGCVLCEESLIVQPKMIIGIKCDSWSNVVDTLHHEVSEFIATEMGLRFRKTGQFGDGNFIFLCDHEQFTEWSMRTTTAFLMALPFLDKEWRKLHKLKSRK